MTRPAVLSPLSLSARLQLNPRPELDSPTLYTTAKARLGVTLQDLNLSEPGQR